MEENKKNLNDGELKDVAGGWAGDEQMVIVEELCNGICPVCRECFKVCNRGAISIVDGQARIDDNKCTYCRCCEDVCPANAIYYNLNP